MSLTAKIVLWLALSTFIVCGAQAHELEEGTGIICDTQQQIERRAALDAKPEAILLINTDAQSNVCAQATIHYIWGTRSWPRHNGRRYLSDRGDTHSRSESS
jgi:hypothetical protein